MDKESDNGSEMILTNFRLSSKIKRDIEITAFALGITQSKLMRMAIGDFLEDHEDIVREHLKLTLEDYSNK